MEVGCHARVFSPLRSATEKKSLTVLVPLQAD